MEKKLSAEAKGRIQQKVKDQIDARAQMMKWHPYNYSVIEGHAAHTYLAYWKRACANSNGRVKKAKYACEWIKRTYKQQLLEYFIHLEDHE